jgi:hypothetical protein
MMRHYRRGGGEQSKAGHENIESSSHRYTSPMIIMLAIYFVGLAVGGRSRFQPFVNNTFELASSKSQ